MHSINLEIWMKRTTMHWDLFKNWTNSHRKTPRKFTTTIPNTRKTRWFLRQRKISFTLRPPYKNTWKYWARIGSVRPNYSNNEDRSASKREIWTAAIKILRKARPYSKKRRSLLKSGGNRLIDDTCLDLFAACAVVLQQYSSKNSDSCSYWKLNRIKWISKIEWTKFTNSYSKFRAYSKN